MKLKSRLKLERKNSGTSTSSSSSIPEKERVGSPFLDASHRAQFDVEDCPMPQKRDRSRSLCVDHTGPLINVEHKGRDEGLKTTALFTRRKSTTNAL